MSKTEAFLIVFGIIFAGIFGFGVGVSISIATKPSPANPPKLMLPAEGMAPLEEIDLVWEVADDQIRWTARTLAGLRFIQENLFVEMTDGQLRGWVHRNNNGEVKNKADQRGLKTQNKEFWNFVRDKKE